jgi:hypothetical protein
MKKHIIPSVITWLPLATAIIVTYGVLYLITNHNIRHAFTETLLQYADDTKAKMETGIHPKDAIADFQLVDIQRSLSPFIIIYDNHCQPVTGSGTLDGKLPAPPPGVFDHSLRNGQNIVTWQPKKGVRNDAVILPYNNGFVLAGHPLRETEQRKAKVTIVMATGLAIALIVSFVMTFILRVIYRGRNCITI